MIIDEQLRKAEAYAVAEKVYRISEKNSEFTQSRKNKAGGLRKMLRLWVRKDEE